MLSGMLSGTYFGNPRVHRNSKEAKTMLEQIDLTKTMEKEAYREEIEIGRAHV